MKIKKKIKIAKRIIGKPLKNTKSPKEELEDAFQMYKDILNNHAYYKTNNKMISEELVQETYLKTWSYLVRGGKIEKMKAFLYHVLNNLIIDQYRKRKETSLDFLIEKGYEPDFDASTSVSYDFENKYVFVLIEKLPETYKTVMRMKYIQDMSLEQMSLITGETKNALAVRLHRGVEKLRELYEK